MLTFVTENKYKQLNKSIMENSNNNGKLVGALLVGAAIGGVLGIFFAPDKGSVTRKKIVGKSEDLADAVKDKFNEFMELARKVIEITGSKSSIEKIAYEKAYPEGFEDMQRRVPDISKIKQVLGWEPKINLDQIIKDIAAFNSK